MAKGLRKLGSRQLVGNFMESQEPCEKAILKEEHLFSYKTISSHLNLCFVLVAVQLCQECIPTRGEILSAA